MANQTVNIDVQVKTKSLAQMEQDLEAINAELKQVEVGSDAFNSLTKQAQAAEKQLADVNKQIEGFTADDKFMAADGAIKLFTGTLQGAVGALGMFGIESEVFGEFEKKAASAIALGIGLKDISEGYNQLSKAFKAATGAQLGFNAATLANPYVIAGAAIAAVVGSLIVQFDTFSKILKDAGLGTIDLSGAWNSLGRVFSGVTNVIAARLGNLVAGIGHLINGRFRKAGENFSKLGVGGTIEAFKEGADRFTANQIKKQGEKQAKDFEEARQEELKKLQKQWLLDDDIKKSNEEWNAEFGKDAAMSFADAFNKQLKEDPPDYGYIDVDAIDALNEHFEPGGIFYETTKSRQEALEQSLGTTESLQRFTETATQAFDIINEAADARYDRQLINLERERSEIESNIRLTEDERTKALEAVDAKEKKLEIERIKREQKRFTLQQTLLIAEQMLKTNMFILDMKQKGMEQIAAASAASKEVALTGAVQVAKAQTSLGAFTAALGPFGIAAFALAIGGIISSIVQAKKSANAEIASLTGISTPGGGGGGVSIPSTPPQITPAQDAIAQPLVRAYVVSGDTRSAEEADAKILSRRTLD
jgi:hypothetical protein